jgi:hypothetical protein
MATHTAVKSEIFWRRRDEETEAVPDNGDDEGGANATASAATPAGSQAPPVRGANHSLIFSEHIPLTGQLASNDYILLMDLTPYTLIHCTKK